MGLDELGQRLLVQKRLGLLVQERLVGRAPSLGDEQEAVRITLSRVQVDLPGRFVPVFFSSVIVNGTTWE